MAESSWDMLPCFSVRTHCWEIQTPQPNWSEEIFGCGSFFGTEELWRGSCSPEREVQGLDPPARSLGNAALPWARSRGDCGLGCGQTPSPSQLFSWFSINLHSLPIATQGFTPAGKPTAPGSGVAAFQIHPQPLKEGKGGRAGTPPPAAASSCRHRWRDAALNPCQALKGCSRALD